MTDVTTALRGKRTREERDYAEFIRSDLHAFLRELRIDVRAERSLLLGAVRIVVLSNHQSDTPAMGRGRDPVARLASGAPV
jgi:hypothetical protein